MAGHDANTKVVYTKNLQKNQDKIFIVNVKTSKNISLNYY